jgi:hypothetical protein
VFFLFKSLSVDCGTVVYFDMFSEKFKSTCSLNLPCHTCSALCLYLMSIVTRGRSLVLSESRVILL